MPMSGLELVDHPEDPTSEGREEKNAPRRRWYALDDADKIMEVSHGWPDMGNQLLGRSIWDFFSGAATHHIYKNIFQSVRDSGTPASVDIRCDQPNRLVELRVRVSQSTGSQLLVSIETLREAPTKYRSIWDPAAVRSGQLVRACSWCQSIQVRDGLWLPFVYAIGKLGLLQANKPPDISHGICENCLAQLETNEKWAS